MTIEQIPSTEVSDDHFLENESDKMTCLDIGLIFAREYYTFLNRKPNRLHAFYGADSLFVRGNESESVPILKGQEEIRKRIEELDFDNCKVLVTQVDSQPSSNDGILISVLGEISNKDLPSEKFAETFFLAPQPNGYYVLNNIFRFLKEKVDIDYFLCDNDEPKNIQEPANPVYESPEAKNMEKKEPEIEATSQKPVLQTQSPQVEVGKKSSIESDEKPVEQKRASEDKKTIIEDKKTIKEKKLNESKVATTNNKSVKDSDSVTTKKVKSSTKNASTNNKKTESQLNGHNSLPSNNKEQSNNKHNEIVASATKDHTNKNNQKGNVGKPVTTNTTVTPVATETTFKSWAKLAAPTPSSDKVSEKAESTKSSPKNNNTPQNRPQLPQTTYSPKSNVHNNLPNQEQPNISYNHQNQSHNTYNYPHQQQQYQPNNAHHYPHQQQHTHNHHHQQYHREGQQQNQYRTDTQIYVRDVHSSMTEEQLGEVFSKFGPVKSVKIITNKNCAFIDYGSIESTQKALEQHKVMIGGNQHVYAEERRPQRPFRPHVDNRRYQHNRRGGGGGGSGTANRGGGLGAGPLVDNKRGSEQK